jgi:hypothetical protein
MVSLEESPASDAFIPVFIVFFNLVADFSLESLDFSIDLFRPCLGGLFLTATIAVPLLYIPEGWGDFLLEIL